MIMVANPSTPKKAQTGTNDRDLKTSKKKFRMAGLLNALKVGNTTTDQPKMKKA